MPGGRNRLRGKNRNLHVILSSVIDSGASKAEDAQGTPTQSHISSSILVYEKKTSAPISRIKNGVPAFRGSKKGARIWR